jgi:hypothetical protein
MIRGEIKKSHEVAISSQALVQGNRVTATSHEWSLIMDYSRKMPELYHLPTDPKQIHNLYNERGEVAEKLHLKTISFLETLGVEEEILRGWRNVSKHE